MSRSSLLRAQARSRRSQLRAGVSLFLVLGFHVGVWAVQLAPLSAGLRLDPGSLGLALTSGAAAGVVTLFAGGHLADRLGRRPVLLLGFGGTALAFALLGHVRTLGQLISVVVLYGLFISFVDLGANTVGSDYEHAHDVQVMTGLHAGFSLGALLGALSSAILLWTGVGFQVVYLVLAAVFLAAAAFASRAPLPPRPPRPPAARSADRSERGLGVWRIRGVAFAIAVVTVTFFGDGALESFLALYLHDALATGVLLSGIGVGSYHLASLVGRLAATRMLRSIGTRRTIAAAGVLASIGIVIAVTTNAGGVAIAGLLLVGFAVAPIVPSALSLAGASAPGRSGQAVALTTAAGYSAFILSPALVGGIATATSLRVAIATLIVTTLIVAVLGSRWPLTKRSDPDTADKPRSQ